jgi:hypothetical protein
MGSTSLAADAAGGGRGDEVQQIITRACICDGACARYGRWHDEAGGMPGQPAQNSPMRRRGFGKLPPIREDGGEADIRRPVPAPVSGSVNEPLRNRPNRGRWAGCWEMSDSHSPSSAATRETYRNGGDGRRTAHNPEVAGSNPAPATRPEAPSDQGRGILVAGCKRSAWCHAASLPVGCYKAYQKSPCHWRAIRPAERRTLTVTCGVLHRHVTMPGGAADGSLQTRGHR